MLRRQFLCLAGLGSLAVLNGCRNKQYARVVKPGESEMVGSHAAGQETYKPLIDEAVGKLIGNCQHGAQQVSYEAAPAELPQRRICFVGLENKSAEEIGDFKAQIQQLIETRLLETHTIAITSGRYVDSALRQLRMRPDDLMSPQSMRQFSDHLEKEGQPFDYLLYAVLTSGTTRENGEYQRDYLLTLEMIDVQTGQVFKESATLSKGYHQSKVSKWSAMNPLGKK